jgi:homoserine dehydrogenase
MAAKNEIGVGLLGLGVIGGQVAAHFVQRSETLSSHLDRPLVLRRVLVRDADAPRSLSFPEGVLTNDFNAVLNDPDIHIVVEVMGGENPAADYLMQLLQKGKSVVTANKEVMAKHGPLLMEAADRSGAQLRFEASVGGGVPIIGPLQNDLLANDITSIRAIINGTTNYILTQMAQEGVGFSVALAQAQKLGYAEPDPTNDVDGTDAAYKIAILASLAFHTAIAQQQVYCEGITTLQSEDFEFAHELGYEIKLLAIAKRTEDGVQARVHPALVHKESMLAKVEGPFNAVEVYGDLVGPVVFHGLGAGPAPTTSAIIGDLLAVARSSANLSPARPWSVLPIKAMADLETQYYLRVSVTDQSGVLGQIARVFGDNNISIATLTQKDVDNHLGTAQLVITTHPAREAAMQTALQIIKQLPVLQEVNNLLRVEPI